MDPQSNETLVVQGTTATALNRWHQIVEERSRCSTQAAAEALVAAWEAGRLLSQEHDRIRRECGHGSWEAWVRENFDGCLTTSKRYVRIFESATRVADLQAMSLRKAYLLLGLVKTKPGEKRLEPLAQHLLWVQKLASFLRRKKTSGLGRDQMDALRDDLRPLLKELQTLGLGNGGD